MTDPQLSPVCLGQLAIGQWVTQLQDLSRQKLFSFSTFSYFVDCHMLKVKSFDVFFFISPLLIQSLNVLHVSSQIFEDIELSRSKVSQANTAK